MDHVQYKISIGIGSMDRIGLIEVVVVVLEVTLFQLGVGCWLLMVVSSVKFEVSLCTFWRKCQ
jgi:hypothetical protein